MSSDTRRVTGPSPIFSARAPSIGQPKRQALAIGLELCFQDRSEAAKGRSVSSLLVPCPPEINQTATQPCRNQLAQCSSTVGSVFGGHRTAHLINDLPKECSPLNSGFLRDVEVQQNFSSRFVANLYLCRLVGGVWCTRELGSLRPIQQRRKFHVMKADPGVHKVELIADPRRACSVLHSRLERPI